MGHERPLSVCALSLSSFSNVRSDISRDFPRNNLSASPDQPPHIMTETGAAYIETC
jgi:hypothetical protein